MIEYEQFCFAAPPRTGNLWFRSAARLCGLRELEIDDGYHTFSTTSKLKVSMVRNPFYWLSSCYNALRLKILSPHDAWWFGNLEYQTTFNTFVHGYLEKYPGYVGKFFDFYRADSVMRLEDQPDSFMELATTLGVNQYWKNAVRLLLPLNETEDTWALDALRVGVYSAEKEFCERYDYW